MKKCVQQHGRKNCSTYSAVLSHVPMMSELKKRTIVVCCFFFGVVISRTDVAVSQIKNCSLNHLFHYVEWVHSQQDIFKCIYKEDALYL